MADSNTKEVEKKLLMGFAMLGFIDGPALILIGLAMHDRFSAGEPILGALGNQTAVTEVFWICIPIAIASMVTRLLLLRKIKILRQA